MKLYAVGDGKTFSITSSKEAAWNYLKRDLKVTVVDAHENVANVPLDRIVGRIGNTWYTKADNQEIR